MQKLSWLILGAAVLFASVGLMALNDAEQTKKEAKAMFTGHEDHSISLDQAIQFTKNFRTNHPYAQANSGVFGKDAMLKILNQEDVVALRLYYGEFDDGRPNMVVVGVTEDGNDKYEGELAELWFPCPPFCPYESPLNEPTDEEPQEETSAQ